MILKPNNELFGVEIDRDIQANLSGKYKNTWVEETVTFENGSVKQPTLIFSTEHLGSHFDAKKKRWLMFVLAALFLMIGLRIMYLQLFNGAALSMAAESNRQRIIPIPAERGLVFDRNDKQLTKNIPNFSLTIIPQDLPRKVQDRESVVNRLAVLTSQSADSIRKILDEYKDYSYESVVIKENLDYNTALLIQIDAPDLPGIQIQRGSKRQYLTGITPEASLATSSPFSLSHILGYESKLDKNDLDKLYKNGYLPTDSLGKNGVEKIYEEDMRGVYGKRRIEVNATGKEINVLAEETPTPGKQLKLSIDAEMQSKLEQIMSNAMRAGGKKRGSGIVMNPQNGEVLAMISLPAYDNNDFSGGISQTEYNKYINDSNNPLFNRAVGGNYPSGSSIKPAIAAVALQDGVITPATSFLSTGGLQMGQWFFPDWQAGGHGITNVRKALAWSVNTFFYYIGGGYGNFIGLGVERMMTGLKLFGFSQKLGIDLPTESAGFLPSKQWKENSLHEKWYVGDTYNLSIGQGNLLVSPLQIASLTNTVANGGTLYRPRVALSTIDPVSKVETFLKPEIIRDNFIDAKNIEIVRLGMRDCVIYGSCRKLSALPFTSAGKTGTAQWNSNKPNHAWFTSFAPFENPQISVTVMVEEGGEGSAITESIANDFYRWWWQNHNKQT